VNRTRCLDTIGAVGLRAISGTIKKSDHTTIGHNRREQWHASVKRKEQMITMISMLPYKDKV
jgi:hypothetical protein